MRVFEPLIAIVVLAGLSLAGCSDDPAGPTGPARSGPYSWAMIDTIGSGGRVSAVYGVPSGDTYFSVVPLDRVADGWTVFPPVHMTHYDGSQWSAVRDFTATTHPQGIWAASSSNVYLADGSLHHFDGSQWTDFTVPVNLIHGTSTTDIYAASSWNDRRVYRYNGSRWSLLRDFGTDNNDPIYSIFAMPGPTLVVVHLEGVSMWNGNEWTEMDYGHGSLHDAWGTASNNIYVAGDPYASEGIILRYDGAQWTNESIPDVPALRAIWGSAANDIYAAGEHGAMIHFNGSIWDVVHSPTCKRIGDIWGNGSNDIYAVGDDGLVLHFNGVSWASVGKNSPDEHTWLIWAESPDRFAAANGLDCGTVYFYKDGSWITSRMPIEATSDLYQFETSVEGMGGTTLDDFWASVEDDMFHYDGAEWKKYRVNDFDAGLAKIWVPDAPAPPLAGGRRGIYAFNGYQWNKSFDTSSDRVVGLWGSGPVVYAITNQNVFVYDGGWVGIPSPEGYLLDISGVSKDEVYVLAADHGTLLWRYDGSGWKKVTPPTFGESIVVGATNNMFVFGGSCYESRFDGGSWSEQCYRNDPPISIVRAMDGSILKLTRRSVSVQQLFYQPR